MLTYRVKNQFGQSWYKNLRWKFAKSVKNAYVLKQIIQKTWNNLKKNIVQQNTLYLHESFFNKTLMLFRFSVRHNFTFKNIMEIGNKTKYDFYLFIYLIRYLQTIKRIVLRLIYID